MRHLRAFSSANRALIISPADAVGAEVESHAFRTSRTRRDYAPHRERLDPADREALAILLADDLEKLVSHNVLYGARRGEARARSAKGRRHGGPRASPRPPRSRRRARCADRRGRSSKRARIAPWRVIRNPARRGRTRRNQPQNPRESDPCFNTFS